MKSHHMIFATKSTDVTPTTIDMSMYSYYEIREKWTHRTIPTPAQAPTARVTSPRTSRSDCTHESSTSVRAANGAYCLMRLGRRLPLVMMMMHTLRIRPRGQPRDHRTRTRRHRGRGHIQGHALSLTPTPTLTLAAPARSCLTVVDRQCHLSRHRFRLAHRCHRPITRRPWRHLACPITRLCLLQLPRSSQRRDRRRRWRQQGAQQPY